MNPRRRSFHVWGNPKIEGCGDAITFIVTAYRTKKTGRREEFEFRFKACRYSVRQLAEEIHAMQERDRERITRELGRIQSEVAPLVRT